VPSDLTLKAMNATHRVLLKLTGGHLGWTAAKMPVLELTTTGRRSGRSHTVLLTSPVRQGPAWIVVASRGGDDNPPAWLLNLIANPDVEVGLQGSPPAPMRARVATGEERARLWPAIAADFQVYAGYQEKTDREIALVVLEPE
jgi:deazaflavin-dependent oxidoreductase (nitroreductase family)